MVAGDNAMTKLGQSRAYQTGSRLSLTILLPRQKSQDEWQKAEGKIEFRVGVVDHAGIWAFLLIQISGRNRDFKLKNGSGFVGHADPSSKVYRKSI